MFPPVLQEIRGYFGTVFLLGVFSPVLFFVSASLTIYFEITQGVGVALAAFEKYPLQTQILLIVGGLVGVTVLSVLIYNFQYSITRLFEGYWPRLGIFRWLRNSRTELHHRRWEYLEILKDSVNNSTERIEIMEEQLIFYPPRIHLKRLMPTRIGNILRASEIYAYDHYGIDSSIVWTRLRPLLPDQVVTPLENNMIAIDFLLLMSVLATIFTLLWCPVLAIFTNRWELFLLCSLGWPLSWMCYKSAVQSATAYSEQLKAIFDLYRHRLLEALKFSIPTDTETEYELWKDISEFFYRNLPIPSGPTVPPRTQVWKRLISPFLEYLKRINSSKS